MRSEASKAQQKAYEKEMTRSLSVKLNRRTDADILAWLEGLPNIQAYLKELVRKDMGPAECGALMTLANADRISAEVEAAEAAGKTEEEIGEILQAMPTAGAMIDAKRIHRLRTTVRMAPGELERIRRVGIWKSQKMDVADLKAKYSLTWSEMEMIWLGTLKV